MCGLFAYVVNVLRTFHRQPSRRHPRHLRAHVPGAGVLQHVHLLHIGRQHSANDRNGSDVLVALSVLHAGLVLSAAVLVLGGAAHLRYVDPNQCGGVHMQLGGHGRRVATQCCAGADAYATAAGVHGGAVLRDEL